MINPQSKSLCLKDSSLTKTEAKTQNSLNNTNDFDYCLKVRHVVDIVPDVPDTSGESKNNIGPPSGGPKITTLCNSILPNYKSMHNVVNLHPLYEHTIHCTVHACVIYKFPYI